MKKKKTWIARICIFLASRTEIQIEQVAGLNTTYRTLTDCILRAYPLSNPYKEMRIDLGKP